MERVSKCVCRLVRIWWSPSDVTLRLVLKVVLHLAIISLICLFMVADCQVDSWQAFSSCSADCGTGLQSRVRQVELQTQFGGGRCPKLYDSRECNTQQCAFQDCELSSWSGFSPCTRSCGGGEQVRSRHILQQPGGGGGMQCGDLDERRACNTDVCVKDCLLREWGEFSQCSKGCGGGTQQRHRSVGVRLADLCAGVETSEQRQCNTLPCQLKCVVSGWGPFSECSKECGAGRQTRTRDVMVAPSEGAPDCPAVQEERSCNTVPCPPQPSATIDESDESIAPDFLHTASVLASNQTEEEQMNQPLNLAESQEEKSDHHTIVLHHTFELPGRVLQIPDVSGNQHNGLFTPGYVTTASQDEAPEGTSAFKFDAGGFYDIPSLKNFDFSEQLSIEFWMKHQGGNDRVLLTNGYTDGLWEIKMGADQGGTEMLLSVMTTGGKMTKSLTIVAGEWVHCAMTISRHMWLGYRNGEPMFEQAIPGHQSSVNNEVRVGADLLGEQQYDGEIDDLRYKLTATCWWSN